MANEIQAKNIGLYIDQGTEGSPDFVLAVCSTSDGFAGAVDAVQISTKCDDGWTSSLPGDGSWSFSHAALAKKTPDTSTISFKGLQDLFLSREVKTFQLKSLDANDDYFWQGQGYISSLNETADAGDYLQVDIEVTGTGKPVNVEST